jgi:hypothetical protein
MVKDYNIMQSTSIYPSLHFDDEGLSFLVAFLVGGLATHGFAEGP